MNADTNLLSLPWLGELRFPPGDDVATFLREGWFEYRESAFLWLYLRDHDTMIDCGAHVGLFTVQAAKIIKAPGRLIAIEPNSDTTGLLRINLAKHDVQNVKVIESAIYRHSGTVCLHITSSEKSAYASLYRSEFIDHDAEVASLTLDDLLVQEKIDYVDFLKIDIEGAELDAIVGAIKSVEAGKLPLIMVEFTELNLQKSGNDTDSLRTALESLGYQLYRFDETTLQLKPYVFDGPVWYENLFACHDVSSVNKRLRNALDLHKLIASELLMRGQAAQRLKERADRLEAAEAEIVRLKERADRLEAAEAELYELRILLHRSHLQHQLAEKRIDDLMKYWPLCLAFKYGLVRRPSWIAARSTKKANDSIVARYIAEHPLHEQGFIDKDSNNDTSKPQLSVILCTYNPRPDLLVSTLESIALQTMDPKQYEVILVDNNSQPPINLSTYPITKYMTITQIHEGRQGLIFARLAGIRASNADLLVFVDDDNILYKEYLEKVLEIARRELCIGLFGGIAYARSERDIAKWKQKLLPYLGIRDHGQEPITSYEEYWGEWEPIGAGMVARRNVAEAYVVFVDNNQMAGGLGRQGSALLSCEDSLFARVANSLGYACSYQPALRLEHYIKSDRLSSRYLFRLLYGLGRSHVRLERVIGRGENVSPLGRRRMLKRLVYRLMHKGLSGIIMWAWDLGYNSEARQLPQYPNDIRVTKQQDSHS